jgi:uncharacterized protein (UPF0332 family)
MDEIQTRRDLSAYRLEKAEDELDTSRLLFKEKKLSQSINRSYYAMFHGARALLALNRLDSKKHSGIISFFNLHYIKTGLIEGEYSTMLNTAFRVRNDSDYDDFYIASREEAESQLRNAEKFLKRIKEYLDLTI